ncbi:hypothetical protein ACJX0J_039181 [Zea mays]
MLAGDESFFTDANLLNFPSFFPNIQLTLFQGSAPCYDFFSMTTDEILEDCPKKDRLTHIFYFLSKINFASLWFFIYSSGPYRGVYVLLSCTSADFLCVELKRAWAYDQSHLEGNEFWN